MNEPCYFFFYFSITQVLFRGVQGNLFLQKKKVPLQKLLQIFLLIPIDKRQLYEYNNKLRIYGVFRNPEKRKKGEKHAYI